MAKKKVTETVAQILEPFLEEEGYELYHSEFVKEGGDWFLRVYIDRASDASEGAGGGSRGTDSAEQYGGQPPEGAYIGTQDCEKVSRYLSEKLDETDPVSQNYYLEVSSPGMDRPLINARHYRLAIGRMIEIKTYKAVDGSKLFTGILKEAEDDHIVIETEEKGELRLSMTEIAKAKMAIVL